MNVERQLSAVLTEFARTLLTDFPIEAILDRLVEEVVEMLPIDSAGVTLISPGSGPRYVAASDDAALQFEQLQSVLGEGPCVAACEQDAPIIIPDLRADDRFPNFRPAALAGGLGAVFTFPLRHGDQRLGALDLYRGTPGALDAKLVIAASTLADVTAAYILNASAREEMRASSERALHLSLHDPLTGLPNRILLVQSLDQAILRCRRSRHTAGIYFVDLDGFKSVNDLHGHRIGDELLVAVAGRLTSLIRANDTLARLGGDEFVILCEDLEDPGVADVVVDRIERALAEPFELSITAVTITASVGIAFAGRDGDVAKEVLHTADMAMYEAKRGRRSHQGREAKRHRARAT